MSCVNSKRISKSKYINQRNQWIRKRFKELDEIGHTVKESSLIIARELRGEISPETVKTIFYK